MFWKFARYAYDASMHIIYMFWNLPHQALQHCLEIVRVMFISLYQQTIILNMFICMTVLLSPSDSLFSFPFWDPTYATAWHLGWFYDVCFCLDFWYASPSSGATCCTRCPPCLKDCCSLVLVQCSPFTLSHYYFSCFENIDALNFVWTLPWIV